MDFKGHLRKQLGFLERSCRAYDEGFTDEAMRIATVIRVLVHQTERSTSLLKYLNATTINLLSTTFDPSLKVEFFVGLGRFRIGEGKAEYLPQLGDGPIKEFVPVSKWWNQVVMVIDGKYRITRKKITLAAANKDGGAHVDQTLTTEYAALSLEGAVGTFVYTTQGQHEEVPIEGAHLVSLRQMGYELLHSSMLVKLCNI